MGKFCQEIRFKKKKRNPKLVDVAAPALLLYVSGIEAFTIVIHLFIYSLNRPGFGITSLLQYAFRKSRNIR